ncbi:lysozyme inhibitor LprI family protein [Phenylobacterium sp.]|uniref:lysozyme inhibitor LprI family protein n=1 Tax=Phenylobacterium sp. TaxID=1871053 RepID=UPI002C755A1C|nr:lysozyme inhibitor LprI family protein [Phenylobacterium sp.]HLZ76236.1 lysozyme inhibitor LprI family protein [Phenylobacterium sp.]
MFVLALALASTLATRGAHAPPGCPGETTLEINACFGERLQRADAELARYAAAARSRLKREAATAPPGDTSAAKALGGFQASERAWSAYRDAECGAVYDNWSAGTIRTVEDLACRIGLTRLRTHTVWENWLTYMDSTPPVLPEPAVPPE